MHAAFPLLIGAAACVAAIDWLITRAKAAPMSERRLAVVLIGAGTAMKRRLPRYPLAKPALSGRSDEFATVLVFSLAGLDLSLWLLAKGLLSGSGDLLNAVLLLGS